MTTRLRLLIALSMIVLLGAAVVLEASFVAQDPGVRGGPAGAGDAIAGLTSGETAAFQAGLEQFGETQSVTGTVPDTESGLGPRFNLDSCAGCHSQPAIGGSSPAVNPQVEMATKEGANNIVPFFVTLDGPVREARFKYRRDGSRDGGVTNLYTIAGRSDAPGCHLEQPDFAGAAASHNLIFRIPTPVFGAGLIGAISDATILDNREAFHAAKHARGISGRANRSGNDGSVTRFGWKAQNKSLPIFAGEAYNVEQGVTNEFFPDEREQKPDCQFNATPESRPNLDTTDPLEALSDTVKFALFMQFLAPPTPASATPSINKGRALFSSIGCALCHTPSLPTGSSSTVALSGKEARLYSDLLLHGMGPGLADDILQGGAKGDEFRTAPLWGLGKRIFFLHDGRARNLRQAINAHASPGNGQFPASEANAVISEFHALTETQKQDLFNFLRSL